MGFVMLLRRVMIFFFCLVKALFEIVLFVFGSQTIISKGSIHIAKFSLHMKKLLA